LKRFNNKLSQNFNVPILIGLSRLANGVTRDSLTAENRDPQLSCMLLAYENLKEFYTAEERGMRW